MITLSLLALLIDTPLPHAVCFSLLSLHLVELDEQIIDIFHRLDSINPPEFSQHRQSRNIIDVDLHYPLLPEEPYPSLRVVLLIHQVKVGISEVHQHQSDRFVRVSSQLFPD